MTKHQEAYRSMAEKVLGEMKRFQDAWKDDQVITGSVANIEAKLAEIKKFAQQQSVNITGSTIEKKQVRDKIDKEMDYLYTAIRAYAKNIGDEKLYETYKASASIIKRIRDTQIGDYAGTTLAYATDNLNELKPYGIREAGLKALQTNIDTYQGILQLPQEIIAERKAATARLKKAFKEAIPLFDDFLDNEMGKYRLDNPEFYEAYVNARIIYDNPTHHKAIHGIVTDEETKEPLENVKVSFLHTESGTNVDKLPTTYTTKKGYYEFKSLPEGPGKVIFKMGYYDTLRMPVNLIPNNDLRLDVAIRKKE